MIGLFPQGLDRQSRVTIEWLEYKARRRGVHVQHAYNGGEHRVPFTNYRLDGYYETAEGEKIAREYHGCFFHGCVSCYMHDIAAGQDADDTMRDRFVQTKIGDENLEGLQCRGHV